MMAANCTWMGNWWLTNGDHGVLERGAAINLTTGRHLVRVEFFNGGGGYHLDVKYQSATIPKQIIPADLLYREK